MTELTEAQKNAYMERDGNIMMRLASVLTEMRAHHRQLPFDVEDDLLRDAIFRWCDQSPRRVGMGDKAAEIKSALDALFKLIGKGK